MRISTNNANYNQIIKNFKVGIWAFAGRDCWKEDIGAYSKENGKHNYSKLLDPILFITVAIPLTIIMSIHKENACF